jgi:hypothetical protein
MKLKSVVRKSTSSAALLTLLSGVLIASSPAAAQDPGWYRLLGDVPGDTTFRDGVDARLAAENRLTAVCKSTAQQTGNRCQLMMPPDDPLYGSLQGHPRQLGLEPFPLLNPPTSAGVPIRRVNWQPVADALSAFVNIYKLARLAGDPVDVYKSQAADVADWFLGWNRWLMARQDQARATVQQRQNPNDPIIPPYVGWYEMDARQGYFSGACAAANRFSLDPGSTRGDYHAGNGPGDPYADPSVQYGADEAWDTAAAVRGLLKYSEIDDLGVNSVYFQRARGILEAWPFRDHASGDGNPDTPNLAGDPSVYAREGMRWFLKSNEPCEVRYVKNTNLVMGEQLLRLYKLSRAPVHLDGGRKVLYSQLWEMVSHLNFGYNGFIVRDLAKPGNVYEKIAADERSKTIETADGIVPGSTQSSFWNHLGFEGYDLYVVQQLISGPEFAPGDFPVPNMDVDVASAITKTMDTWRSSPYGDPNQWVPGSATHLTAYNCALRFSNDRRLTDCKTALGNGPTGHTIFYSLVPDALFTQGPAR